MTDTKSSTLPVFLAGLGTGIALALLVVPLSGADTRNLIRRKVAEGEDWARATAADLRDRVKDTATGALGAGETRS